MEHGWMYEGWLDGKEWMKEGWNKEGWMEES